MIKKGFDHVDEKFDQVDKRFEQVDKRFETLEKDVTNIGHKVNQIDKRLFSLEEDICVTKKKQQDNLGKRVVFIETNWESKQAKTILSKKEHQAPFSVSS